MLKITVYNMEGTAIGEMELEQSIFGIIPNKSVLHDVVAFGLKPRDYSYRLNKKVKRLALKSAPSDKVQNNAFIVVDSIALETYRTKSIIAMLTALGAEKKTLIATSASDKIVYKSASNIPRVETTIVGTWNTYSILNCDTFITEKDAVSMITERYFNDE